MMMSRICFNSVLNGSVWALIASSFCPGVNSYKSFVSEFGRRLSREDRTMEILGTEKLTDEKWVNLFVRRFRGHGKEGRWIFASHHAAPAVPAEEVDAVVIVPILLA